MYVPVQLACVLLIQRAVPSPDMARNRWSWRLIGAATAAVTAVFSIRPALKKSWSVSSALSRMLCMLAFVLSTARRMARLLPAKLLKKFASAWRLRD